MTKDGFSLTIRKLPSGDTFPIHVQPGYKIATCKDKIHRMRGIPQKNIRLSITVESSQSSHEHRNGQAKNPLDASDRSSSSIPIDDAEAFDQLTLRYLGLTSQEDVGTPESHRCLLEIAPLTLTVSTPQGTQIVLTDAVDPECSVDDLMETIAQKLASGNYALEALVKIPSLSLDTSVETAFRSQKEAAQGSAEGFCLFTAKGTKLEPGFPITRYQVCHGDVLGLKFGKDHPIELSSTSNHSESIRCDREVASINNNNSLSSHRNSVVSKKLGQLRELEQTSKELMATPHASSYSSNYQRMDRLRALQTAAETDPTETETDTEQSDEAETYVVEAAVPLRPTPSRHLQASLSGSSGLSSGSASTRQSRSKERDLERTTRKVSWSPNPLGQEAHRKHHRSRGRSVTTKDHSNNGSGHSRSGHSRSVHSTSVHSTSVRGSSGHNRRSSLPPSTRDRQGSHSRYHQSVPPPENRQRTHSPLKSILKNRSNYPVTSAPAFDKYMYGIVDSEEHTDDDDSGDSMGAQSASRSQRDTQSQVSKSSKRSKSSRASKKSSSRSKSRTKNTKKVRSKSLDKPSASSDSSGEPYVEWEEMVNFDYSDEEDVLQEYSSHRQKEEERERERSASRSKSRGKSKESKKKSKKKKHKDSKDSSLKSAMTWDVDAGWVSKKKKKKRHRSTSTKSKKSKTTEDDVRSKSSKNSKASKSSKDKKTKKKLKKKLRDVSRDPSRADSIDSLAEFDHHPERKPRKGKKKPAKPPPSGEHPASVRRRIKANHKDGGGDDHAEAEKSIDEIKNAITSILGQELRKGEEKYYETVKFEPTSHDDDHPAVPSSCRTFSDVEFTSDSEIESSQHRQRLEFLRQNVQESHEKAGIAIAATPAKKPAETKAKAAASSASKDTTKKGFTKKAKPSTAWKDFCRKFPLKQNGIFPLKKSRSKSPKSSSRSKSVPPKPRSKSPKSSPKAARSKSPFSRSVSPKSRSKSRSKSPRQEPQHKPLKDPFSMSTANFSVGRDSVSKTTKDDEKIKESFHSTTPLLETQGDASAWNKPIEKKSKSKAKSTEKSKAEKRAEDQKNIPTEIVIDTNSVDEGAKSSKSKVVEAADAGTEPIAPPSPPATVSTQSETEASQDEAVVAASPTKQQQRASFGSKPTSLPEEDTLVNSDAEPRSNLDLFDDLVLRAARDKRQDLEADHKASGGSDRTSHKLSTSSIVRSFASLTKKKQPQPSNDDALAGFFGQEFVESPSKAKKKKLLCRNSPTSPGCVVKEYEENLPLIPSMEKGNGSITFDFGVDRD